MNENEQHLPETPAAEPHVLDFQRLDSKPGNRHVTCLSLASQVDPE
jgi:hypothetical protein